MSASENAPTPLYNYRRYWAECFGPAPELPMSRAEMDALGWDSCDIIIVTGDSYVDHPSFGMAVIGRVLEAQGFRVGIIAQPDWTSAEAFKALGRPNLFFGVAAGNMDSMINRYTADRKRRNDDAYTPGNEGGKRPDRAVVVYSQRVREAFKDVPLVIGSIEASLRRIAHYDYWSDKVRRSVLLDSRADLLLYGNAERAIVDVAHRLAAGESIRDIRDLRGTGFVRKRVPEGWRVVDSTDIDVVGPVEPHINPYADTRSESCATSGEQDGGTGVVEVMTPGGALPAAVAAEIEAVPVTLLDRRDTRPAVIRIPAYEQVKDDPVLYAHASRILHKETNPHNARPLVQAHGDRDVWLNPPPIPLDTDELDWVFELPYTRLPHTAYGDARIPAYEMIRHSVNIMRGCFGGCTFCSITEHEGRIIQNRSEDSIIREVERIRDTSPAFTGVISDLGGPTANMWRLACKSTAIEAACRKLSCVFPGICKNLNTDQTPLISLYRRARAVPGVKKVLIASGLRYDLAVETPEYVEELVTHHVGGYLKIAPEHTEDAPLSKMMKPGMGSYDRFKAMFEKYSKKAGKEQYLIPYFIAAHPGTRDEDMMNLALWLKRNKFRADQVQTFYPSPMATATAMYHSGKNPLKKVSRGADTMPTVKKLSQRRLHKAFLRYHDPDNWPELRKALKKMGRSDLIGNGKVHLVPPRQPPKRHQRVAGDSQSRPFATQHNGLPRTPKAPRRKGR
ncbi:YgiQ family radical SAM protein [Parahaliea aestuarii]|uniref:YgiQ family radical SAM protein n=1 Tax=Parahaliea aestuarii TaxID=1852021 RepID=A0A5C8ZRA8_9GAMM|nr:YgiQ family radical SAM protein [Parahaliea aestuarii]TXS91008.1 YgiQ family radical SAM protein [Parahaliea aestuarii]